MTLRDQLEQLEEQVLAPYAMRSRDTRGRQHPEPEHDARTVYQRDRERILHTAAFRRLRDKTQVFVATEGDHYRTRLTHTLEVAQIGRAVARMLRVNEDLTEAVCLAHDLGHPPFGHPGEYVLDELMREHGGFNHGDQSLRVVDRLEQRYPGFRGLNLSWETREGMVKHETDYDSPDAKQFEPGRRATVEAQIVNHTDEIAYLGADLDDGLHSGILTPDMFKGIALWHELLDGQDPGETISDLDRHVLVRRFIDRLVSDLVEATHGRLEAGGIDSVEAVRDAAGDVVGPSDRTRRNLKELSSFLYEHFYFDRRVRRMAAKAGRVLRDIFEAYLDEPKQMPPEVLCQAEEHGLERTICDYLAGMTDRFALEEHGRLFDPAIRV
ncbi:MAG: deoxyguanosinetriphosphate triphosphohydrolase [Planctomycetota bacterium]|jgi:dGTPase